MIRAQFDATRDEKDMRKLAAMLDETEEKIFQSRHLQPNFYALDEGGICYNRELSNVDMQLDTLHPWEQVRLMHHCGNYGIFVVKISSNQFLLLKNSTLN